MEGTISTVSKFFEPVTSRLPTMETVKAKLQETSSRISDFVQKNKALVFFAASALFTIIATRAPFEDVSVLDSVASGVFSACLLQGLALYLGGKGLVEKENDDKITVLMGGLNLAAWWLSPGFGVAMSCFNIGIQGCTLAYRKFVDLQQK